MLRDGVHDVGVAVGFLPDVEADEGETEGGDLAEEIQEAAVCYWTITTSTE